MDVVRQDALVAALGDPENQAWPVTEAEDVALRYSDLLTRAPWKVSASIVAELRAAGFDDRGIHDLCAIVSYFGFVNRIADGLGVELESSPPAGHG
jgi:alkylhydroperoxidase family enzyme